MSTPNIHVLFFAIFASLLSSTCCDIDRPQHDVALFVFGDSLNDAGTNNYINTTASFRANFPPYGETFFHYPTGRFTDGRLIADFIAEYAKLPLIPPYLQLENNEFVGGANFASGGAGVLPDTYQGSVVDLGTQLKQFVKLVKGLRKKLGDEKAKRIVSEGVYMISIGGNDYLTPVLNNPTLFQSISMEDYVGMVVGNISTVLEGIYKVGARKFGFFAMPPLGCLPAVRLVGGNGSCSRPATELVKLHNVALPAALAKLESQLQGFKYSLFDLYTSLNKRIQYPSKYGFKDGKSACCGTGPYNGLLFSCGKKNGTTSAYTLCSDPSEYVWFDAAHPTEMVNRQLASLLWDGPSHTVGPYNLKMFFEMP
ncbi:GDSL esterase/lipase 4-like isoform X3 [Syzygium oleosum]|uniref:GDSL esterase/lipase 4-like isoform X3 n=1 Tax=Syzygium oleosum TaxID=219896 RepID=UPI0024B94E2D|nr:GDSL esterase/lipase 4-like isoform X3 [Syzygium oleosum]